jgi:hypothetical protein
MLSNNKMRNSALVLTLAGLALSTTLSSAADASLLEGLQQGRTGLRRVTPPPSPRVENTIPDAPLNVSGTIPGNISVTRRTPTIQQTTVQDPETANYSAKKLFAQSIAYGTLEATGTGLGIARGTYKILNGEFGWMVDIVKSPLAWPVFGRVTGLATYFLPDTFKAAIGRGISLIRGSSSGVGLIAGYKGLENGGFTGTLVGMKDTAVALVDNPITMTFGGHLAGKGIARVLTGKRYESDRISGFTRNAVKALGTGLGITAGIATYGYGRVTGAIAAPENERYNIAMHLGTYAALGHGTASALLDISDYFILKPFNATAVRIRSAMDWGYDKYDRAKAWVNTAIKLFA